MNHLDHSRTISNEIVFFFTKRTNFPEDFEKKIKQTFKKRIIFMNFNENKRKSWKVNNDFWNERIKFFTIVKEKNDD